MDSYLILPLVQVGFGLILLPFVLIGRFRNPTNRLFSLYLFGLILWGVLIFLYRSSPTTDRALFWDTWAASVLPVMGVIFYHFSVSFSGFRPRKWLIPSAYATCLIFFLSARIGWALIDMKVTSYGYSPIGSPILWFQCLFAYVLIVMALINFLRVQRTASDSEQQNRSTYIIVGLVLSMVGGVFDLLPMLGLPLYPGAIIGNIVFCAFVTVAIAKYHLLDIRIVIRKSLVYILMSAMLAIPYVGLLYLLEYLFKPAPEKWWVHVSIILLLAVLLRPIYSRAQDWVDRLFYRDRYDYLRALERFSRETQSVTDLKELGASLVQLVSGALRIQNIHLLLPSEGKQGLYVVSSTSLESPTLEVVLSNSSPLVKWLDLHRDIITSEQLNIIPQLQSFPQKEGENLERMRAELFVPVKTRQGKLSGILILGQKLSQQVYSNEEKQLLRTLSNQMATALENARLYSFEKTAREQLEKQDRIKTEFLHSVAHELKTPLTAIISSSMILDEEPVANIDFRKRLIGNIRRSAGNLERRVNELLDLARIQIEELKIKPEPQDVGSLITDIASQVNVLFAGKEQKLVFAVADSLPKVNADKAKLEQVLINLLSNANKYSPSGTEITVRASEIDGSVVIVIEDSAPAVAEEEKEIIFNPYYRGDNTSKNSQQPGLGLGLAIARKIVELHQGKIWVDSKPTKGNKFAFSLPALDQKTNRID